MGLGRIADSGATMQIPNCSCFAEASKRLKMAARDRFWIGVGRHWLASRARRDTRPTVVFARVEGVTTGIKISQFGTKFACLTSEG
jgi:hypothetical protein